jgi:hypothetical protein
MHALEIIGVYHPEPPIRDTAWSMYLRMVHSMHLNPETPEQQSKRLTEDRIANLSVVS